MRSAAKIGFSHNREAEVDSEGTWAISYGDLVTLLLCFFILFFSLDKPREKRAEMRAAMTKVLEENQTEAASNSRVPWLKPREPASVSGGGSTAVSEALKKTLGPVVHQLDEKLIVEYPGVSFFDSAEIAVSPQGVAVLKEFATKFVPFAGTHILGIRAFTDTQKVKSTAVRFKDNLELSALRSVATMRVLSKAGVPMFRMRLGGYGELKITADQLASQMVTENKSTRALDLARKVVLVIEPDPELIKERKSASENGGEL